MILPKTNHAAQQIGSPQKRTVAGSRAADHDVVSAAGANVPPVDHEFFAAKPGLPRFLVKHRPQAVSIEWGAKWALVDPTYTLEEALAFMESLGYEDAAREDEKLAELFTRPPLPRLH